MSNIKTRTDEELVVLYAKCNNNTAFDVLLSRHKTSIYNYIYFTVRNNDLADDIFQETFVKAIVMLKQGRYTETGKFKAWVTRIAHNLIIDYYRQEKNDKTISNDDVEVDILNDIRLCDSNVEDDMIQSQVLSDVRKLVTFLPENQREVLEMRFYQDLSFKEIADLTGVSINTALGRMRYAILNMRRMVEENRMELTFS